MKNLFYRSVLLLLMAMVSIASVAQSKVPSAERERARERDEYIIQEKMAEMEKLKAEKELQIEKLRADKFGNYIIASPEGGVFFSGANTGQSSQLSLSKSFSGESTKNEGTFEVDENVGYINFSVNGSVKEGRININIVLPNGEKMKEITIDNTADIQFNQMIRPRSEEKKYSGKWSYEIEAVKAVGNYRLSLQTN
jgi:hypothetical protein